MTDLAREKYLRLMKEIEDLEEQIEDLEENKNSPELPALKEKLADKRSELARISDGCGKPHSH